MQESGGRNGKRCIQGRIDRGWIDGARGLVNVSFVVVEDAL